MVFAPRSREAADTAYRIGRSGAHKAPVENAEGEVSKKANKRQTLFSPIVRYWTVLPSRHLLRFHRGKTYGQTPAFSIFGWLPARRRVQSWARRWATIGFGGDGRDAGTGNCF